jgi:hypothetical protein
MNNLEKQLESIGKAFLKIFDDADKAAVVAEPFVDVAFPILAPVYNAAANGAAAATKAGVAAIVPSASEADNMLAVAVAVEPILSKFAQAGGLPAPTTATVMTYAAALQKSLAAAAAIGANTKAPG